MSDLSDDLHERWLPSAGQMALADGLLNAGYLEERDGPQGKERGVYTAHLLLIVEYGFWTSAVELVFLDGVFVTREAVLRYVYNCARDRFFDADNEGKPLVGGWAWHFAVGQAAVWDDIMSQFPKDK